MGRLGRSPIAAAALVSVGMALIATAGVGLWRSASAEPGDTPPPLGAWQTTPSVTSAPSAPASATSADVVAAPSTAAPAPSAASAPGAQPSVASDTTSFTAAQVSGIATTFLSRIQAGGIADARALCTSRFAAAPGDRISSAAPGDLAVFEVLMAIRENGRWVVYAGERWRDGERQTRYLFEEGGGRILIDGVDYADLP